MQIPLVKFMVGDLFHVTLQSVSLCSVFFKNANEKGQIQILKHQFTNTF